MDKKIEKYEQIVLEFLHEYANMYNRQGGEVEAKVIADKERLHYQLLSQGWNKGNFQIYIIFHFDLQDGKVWIQENRTDVLIAKELVERGIPKSDIVLGFHHPDLRSASGYAVA